MKPAAKRLIAFAAIWAVVFALMFGMTAASADDPQTTIALLQAALGVCQQQTTQANADALNKITPLVVEVERLRARVRELEEAKAKK